MENTIMDHLTKADYTTKLEELKHQKDYRQMRLDEYILVGDNFGVELAKEELLRLKEEIEKVTLVLKKEDIRTSLIGQIDMLLEFNDQSSASQLLMELEEVEMDIAEMISAYRTEIEELISPKTYYVLFLDDDGRMCSANKVWLDRYNAQDYAHSISRSRNPIVVESKDSKPLGEPEELRENDIPF